MTRPEEHDMIALATPYALHAMPEAELEAIERRIADAPADVAAAFVVEVRAVHETMAAISASTAVEPPTALRDRLLESVETPTAPVTPMTPLRSNRWRTTLLAAAAVLVIGLGALGVGLALRPAATPSTAAEVFSAPDVRSVSGDIPGGGTATVVFSKERDAGVLVMNNVTPPEPGSVYQMWLIAADGPHSAGTMDAGAIAPSTTAVLSDLDNSRALAFTVEPGAGSASPTGPVFAELQLS